jgi:uncharacterized membrane protein
VIGGVRLSEVLTQETLLETAGRLHPLVLHLPIGLIVLLVAVEFVRLFQRGERRAERPMLVWVAVWLAALSAAAAVGSGWMLGGSDAYAEGGTLTLHRWLGVAVGSGSLLAALAWTVRWTRGYQVFLLLTAGVLLPAGHYGGTMTHGAGFVTEPIRAAIERDRATREGDAEVEVPPAVETPADPAGPAAPAPPADPIAVVPPVDEPPVALGALNFATDVLPILDARCASCHGDRRQRGGLRLTSSVDIAAGGDAGAVVPTTPLSPEAAREAELLRRILLPLEDEYHMPPEGRRQPTADEIALLTTWIEAGAPFDRPFGDPPTTAPEATPEPAPEPTPEPTPPAPAAAPEPSPAPAPAIDPDAPRPADPAALAAIRARFATVIELVPGQPGLLVDLGVAPQPLPPAELRALLAPLGRSIVELGLARSAVDDTLAPTLIRMRHLESLDLRDTQASDVLVASLVDLPHLRELVLTGTPVGDAGIAAIGRGMPALERVHVFGTAASEEAIAALRAARPELRVLVDPLADVEPLETEPEITLRGDRPLPGATGATGATAAPPPDDLRPVNAVCPVSGAPVDDRSRIVHDGQVIGLCCPDCIGRFLADPGAHPVTLARGARGGGD